MCFRPGTGGYIIGLACAVDRDSRSTGTRSKIFNEIVLKNNRLLTLHENCI